MQTTKFNTFDCVSLKNASICLLVTRSVGPRIISLRFNDGNNLLAELPDFVTEHPDGERFHFYGGHRLWHAPESMPRTYIPDDEPVDIVQTQKGLVVKQPVEVQTGIEKSIEISLVEDKPQVIVHHTLTNHNLWPVECAPWAITQLRTGGVAILPQSCEQTEFLPNRSMTLWPYSDFANEQVSWGNRYILIHAKLQDPFKVGFPNPRGWLAYWLEGTLFVKRATFNSYAAYYDYNSSSECYCNNRFIELETLAPISNLKPGMSVTHTEIWELYSNIAFPSDEAITQSLVEKLRLE